MFNRNRNKPVAAQETEEDNVYAMIPPAGTIIGEATEEEMNKVAELEIGHIAFMRLQDMSFQFDGTSYKELLNDFREFEKENMAFWRAISKRLGVPFEWPIRIDHANGPIYIGENDFDVIEEEEDEN